MLYSIGLKQAEPAKDQKPRPIKTEATSNSDNVLKRTKTGHSLVMVKRTRVKGYCVECIKQKNDPMYKKNLVKIITHCPKCPGGNWICEPCFDKKHKAL